MKGNTARNNKTNTMKKNTTANDLIAAIDLMFDSIDQASLTLFNRWETLTAEGEDNAASLAIFEALVATSKRSTNACPYFTEIANMCYLAGWEWSDFNADMLGAYKLYLDWKGEKISAKKLNSRAGGCWGRFKKDPELWGEYVEPKEKKAEDELANILKTLRRVKAKLEEMGPDDEASAKVQSSLNDIQSLITIG